MIETYLKTQEEITFGFWKPFRRMKSHAQLKKYYLLLHKLLTKLGVYPNSDAVKAVDEEIKKRHALLRGINQKYGGMFICQTPDY
jgi:hypothetical protein